MVNNFIKKKLKNFKKKIKINIKNIIKKKGNNISYGLEKDYKTIVQLGSTNKHTFNNRVVQMELGGSHLFCLLEDGSLYTNSSIRENLLSNS